MSVRKRWSDFDNDILSWWLPRRPPAAHCRCCVRRLSASPAERVWHYWLAAWPTVPDPYYIRTCLNLSSIFWAMTEGLSPFGHWPPKQLTRLYIIVTSLKEAHKQPLQCKDPGSIKRLLYYRLNHREICLLCHRRLSEVVISIRIPIYDTTCLLN